MIFALLRTYKVWLILPPNKMSQTKKAESRKAGGPASLYAARPRAAVLASPKASVKRTRAQARVNGVVYIC